MSGSETDKAPEAITQGKPKHPWCRKCGWRKGGVDSWNGKTCKCGDYAPPLPDEPATVTPISKPISKPGAQ
jgi:hypothetical protein